MLREFYSLPSTFSFCRTWFWFWWFLFFSCHSWWTRGSPFLASTQRVCTVFTFPSWGCISFACYFGRWSLPLWGGLRRVTRISYSAHCPCDKVCHFALTFGCSLKLSLLPTGHRRSCGWWGQAACWWLFILGIFLRWRSFAANQTTKLIFIIVVETTYLVQGREYVPAKNSGCKMWLSWIRVDTQHRLTSKTKKTRQLTPIQKTYTPTICHPIWDPTGESLSKLHLLYHKLQASSIILNIVRLQLFFLVILA